MGYLLSLTACGTTTPVPVASVVISPANATIATGTTIQLTATLFDASGSTLQGRVISWRSSSELTATVTGSGKVRGYRPAR